MDNVYEKVRFAIEAANVNGDAEFGYGQEMLSVAGKKVNQLRVQYSGGNEYLRLDTMLRCLGEIGKLLLFEFRGRGTGESPKLVAEMRVQDEVYQILYFLPDSEE